MPLNKDAQVALSAHYERLQSMNKKIREMNLKGLTRGDVVALSMNEKIPLALLWTPWEQANS